MAKKRRAKGDVLETTECPVCEAVIPRVRYRRDGLIFMIYARCNHCLYSWTSEYGCGQEVIGFVRIVTDLGHPDTPDMARTVGLLEDRQRKRDQAIREARFLWSIPTFRQLCLMLQAPNADSRVVRNRMREFAKSEKLACPLTVEVLSEND